MNIIADNNFSVLTAEEIEAVSGGWCGTVAPGTWPRPAPTPDPWFSSITSTLSKVSLNPQPLPPRTAGLTLL